MIQHFLVTLLIIIIAFSGNISFAQPRELKGTWISPEQDIIEILETGRTSNNYLANKLLNEDHFELYILGDTLSFQQTYTSSVTNFKVEYTDRFDLKIVSVNDSALVVKPVSEFSKKYFQDRPIIRLRRKELIVDKTLVFERLFYQAIWSGPTIELEVDSTRHAYMNYTNTDEDYKATLATGSYSAVLNDETFNELICQLQNCSLRTLKFIDVKGADSPVKTLIVYFNGKRKYLKSIAPSRVAEDLLRFINWQLVGYDKWTPAVHKMEIKR
ncbi:hypothetical protein [Dyadobacter sp. CY326]|uniref:hypothetical protein n=1 Tax=Dyadobacter sp. CY326 TaxID=2907300 RepID=UPI001F1F802F|nr:hypothetical protein [Dyadobacter sp. CY326]